MAVFTCAMCAHKLDENNFWPSNTYLSKYTGGHLVICKECLKKIYNERLFEVGDQDPRVAMFYICGDLGLMYDPELIEDVYVRSSDDEWPDCYLEKLTGAENTKDQGISFANKLNCELFKDIYSRSIDEEKLSFEDKENKADIKRVFLCDPFEDKPISDRPELYRSLSLMIDPSMSQDLVRQKAAITIVNSFHQLDQLDKTISKMMQNPETLTENADNIKTLNTMRSEQQRIISNFSKDNGFSEKYATSKSKGGNSLSGIMKQMLLSNYDDDMINKYDIETSASMQQCAEISAAAIAKQLTLSEYDYAQMVEEQAQVVREQIKLRKDAEEQLRLLMSKLRKQELIEELRAEYTKKGLLTKDIDELLNSEYTVNQKKGKGKNKGKKA